jgi:hypothetical protein
MYANKTAPPPLAAATEKGVAHKCAFMGVVEQHGTLEPVSAFPCGDVHSMDGSGLMVSLASVFLLLAMVYDMRTSLVAPGRVPLFPRFPPSVTNVILDAG